MNKKDIEQDKVTDGTEKNEEGKQEEMHKVLEKVHTGWEKFKGMFEEGPIQDWKDLHYPIMIITIACVVIAICTIFMTFTLFGIAKGLRKLCMLQRYSFPF